MKHHRRLEKCIFWALLALLVWAPIPLGSNRPWAWALLAIASFALVALWTGLWVFSQVRIPQSLTKAWPAFLALALWNVYTALSILPLPREWVAALSPSSAGLYALAEIAGVHADSITLSIERHASEVVLFKSLSYTAVFFLFLAVVNNRSRFLIAAGVLVGAATLHVIYALAMHGSKVTEVYLGTTIVHGAAATGFYPNQNHFAGMIEMALAIAVGLLTAPSSEPNQSWSSALKSLVRQVFTIRMLLRLVICILVVGLAATHSRMGNAAFLSSLLATAAIVAALTGHLRRGTLMLIATIVVIDLAVVGSWFGAGKLAERIESTTVQDVEDRGAVARLSLGIIRDYPVFGSGAGTFYVAFPRYRTDDIRGFFSHAHNDYVEVASESGVIGLAILGFLVATSLFAALAGQRVRRDPAMKAASFASIMGVAAMLIHSWVDFNLQIPANAMLFVVLLAFGWISRYLDASPKAAPAPVPGDPSDIAENAVRQ